MVLCILYTNPAERGFYQTINETPSCLCGFRRRCHCRRRCHSVVLFLFKDETSLGQCKDYYRSQSSEPYQSTVSRIILQTTALFRVVRTDTFTAYYSCKMPLGSCHALHGIVHVHNDTTLPSTLAWPHYVAVIAQCPRYRKQWCCAGGAAAESVSVIIRWCLPR